MGHPAPGGPPHARSSRKAAMNGAQLRLDTEDSGGRATCLPERISLYAAAEEDGGDVTVEEILGYVFRDHRFVGFQ